MDVATLFMAAVNGRVATLYGLLGSSALWLAVFSRMAGLAPSEVVARVLGYVWPEVGRTVSQYRGWAAGSANGEYVAYGLFVAALLAVAWTALSHVTVRSLAVMGASAHATFGLTLAASFDYRVPLSETAEAPLSVLAVAMWGAGFMACFIVGRVVGLPGAALHYIVVWAFSLAAVAPLALLRALIFHTPRQRGRTSRVDDVAAPKRVAYDDAVHNNTPKPPVFRTIVHRKPSPSDPPLYDPDAQR